MKYSWNQLEAWAKTFAVLLLSALVYFSFSAFVGACLPVERSLAVAVGLLTGFPAWIAAMCYAVLARSGRRAWAVLVLLVVVFGLSVTLTKILP